MDRFIAPALPAPADYPRYLKSNMDRFIAGASLGLCKTNSYLKSNMDRFIGVKLSFGVIVYII